ncbi:MAG: hypothetical protein GXP08_11210 [Gammaproteobacteria bacterium]|nr:hypothetical protein [Gammaproteobacteria bacterium]
MWIKRFDRATKTWGAAEKVELINKKIGLADLSVFLDPNDRGLVVWEQSGIESTPGKVDLHIMAKRIDATNNKLGTVKIIEIVQRYAVEPHVAMNSFGDAVAVWTQRDSVGTNVWANRFNADANDWGVAELIETTNQGNVHNPQVAINLRGHAIAVWYQKDDTGTNAWANRLE